MTLEEAFHELVLDQGGRVIPSAVDSKVDLALDYVAHRAREFLRFASIANPRIPPIHLDFVNNYSLNAFATRLGDQYFIGINRGTVAILSFVFDRLLADRSVLPFFGQVELEDDKLPLMPAIGPDFFESVKGVEVFLPPQDPSRRALAKRLTEIAMDFIVAHEFAHIANGHVDYLNENYGLNWIEETSTSPVAGLNGNSVLPRRTLEMNADEVATVFTIVTEWKRSLRKIPRRGSEWDDLYDSPGMITMLWSYAVAILCRIFGDIRLEFDAETSRAYPTWRTRSVMIQQTVGEIKRPSTWDTSSIMPNEDAGHSMPLVALATFRHVERDFATITGLPVAITGLDEAWSDLGRLEVVEMRSFWERNLRIDLGPLAFQPLNLLTLSFFE